MFLSKAFLEKNLGEPISDFTTSDATQVGDNVAGCLKAVKVTTALGKTVNLIYKGLTDNMEFKAFVQLFGIFRTEVTMYEKVLPRLSKLLKARGVPRPDLPVPKFYSGQYEGEDFYVLLENVRPQGYIMADKFKGLSLPEVSLMMREIARFHAITHFWLKYEGEKVFDEDESVKRIRDSMFVSEDEQMKFISITMFSHSVKNAIELLKIRDRPEWAQKLQDTLDSAPDAVYKLMKGTSKLTDTQVFPCIIHGDLWMNNCLFRYDQSGNPTDVMLVDFQQSRRGNIFEELEYFFLCSTTPSFRKDHLSQVLNIYYESFVSTLAELRCPVPIGFSRGSLIQTFYEQLRPGYFYLTFAIPFQLTQPLDMAAMAELAKAGEKEGAGGEPEVELSPMQMMGSKFEMQSKMFYVQMLKSPKAIDRLVDVTLELVEMKLL